MIYRFMIFFVLLNFTVSLYSEDKITVQNVKGSVINKNTQQPVAGATIRIINTKYGAITQNDGSFKIKNVPVGRQAVNISAIGFYPFLVNIVVTSGSESQINAELSESFIKTDTVQVEAYKNNFVPLNENAIVSSTTFSKDDVERFAGSRMDPARMAQNYAGVLGADDRRNDIIVRGGSPTELLWRLDGLDIPNPNHFATQGATGGPVNALNHNLLSNSDFFTGAFPAEYGDRMSGVFDLKTRKGNMDRYEFLGEFGFNGFELGAQGPMGLEKSSFIINYRYSFLDLLQKMGVNFGFAGIPRYQDLMLKSNWDIDKNNMLSLTGLYGTSDIYIQDSKLDTVYTGDFDIKNGTDIYSVGLNWKSILTDHSFGNMVLGYVSTTYRTHLDSITTNNNNKVTAIDPWYDNNSKEGYVTLKYDFHNSFSQKSNLSAGVEARDRFYTLNEKRLTLGYFDKTIWNLNQTGTTLQFLGYADWNLRLTENFTANAGIHSEYLQISKKTSFEPRIAFSYSVSDLDKVNIGFGIHNQSLPLLVYYSMPANNTLDFMKSTHYIIGWNHIISDEAIIKIEGYYKDLSFIPIFKDSSSSTSLINSGANFGSIGQITENLSSNGVGRAYGAELSLIKNFSNGYYVTATASYVRQQYKGSDNIWRFGAFDNIYILNLLAGYEWKLNQANTIEFSFKYTLAGGSPYTPIDTALSRISGTTYYSDKNAFSLRNKPYSRFDIRIDFKQNFNSWSAISYISIENLMNTQNPYMRLYNRQYNKVDLTYQMGFFFVGGVRFEF